MYHFYTIFPHFMQFTLSFIYSCFMSLGSTVSYFCVDVNLFPTSFSCIVYSLSIWNLRLSRLRIKEYYIEYRVKVLEWSGLLLLHCALKVYGGISVIQSSECLPCHHNKRGYTTTILYQSHCQTTVPDFWREEFFPFVLTYSWVSQFTEFSFQDIERIVYLEDVSVQHAPNAILTESEENLLTLYTLTSVSIFSILFPIHFLWYWQGEFL